MVKVLGNGRFMIGSVRSGFNNNREEMACKGRRPIRDHDDSKVLGRLALDGTPPALASNPGNLRAALHGNSP